MKKLLILLIALLISGEGWAATYNGVTYTEVFYMSANGDGSAPTDGTAAHAWGVSDFNTAEKWATTNSVDGKLGRGDCLVVLDDSGEISGSTALQTRASGALGGRITIVGETGGTATINTTATSSFYVAAHDYLTLSNLIFKGGSTRSVYIQNSNYTQVQNCTFNTGVTACTSSNNTGTEFTNITLILTGTSGLIFSNSTALNINGLSTTDSTGTVLSLTNPVSATIANFTVNGCAKYAMTVDAVTNGTLIGSGWNFTNCKTDAVYFNGDSQTNLHLELSDITITGSNTYGLDIRNATFDSTSSISDFDIGTSGSSNIYLINSPNFIIKGSVGNLSRAHHSTAGDGVYLDNSGSALVEYVEADYNGRDGIATLNNSTNCTIRFNSTHHNGQADVAANGDGITTHSGCTGQAIYYNLTYSNRNSGFAMASGSAGYCYNNSIVYNGDSTSSNMGVRGGFWSGAPATAWTLKNNIFIGNFPSEIRGSTDGLAGTVSDYNDYYHVGNGITTQPYVYNETTLASYTFSEWKSAYNQDSHSISADPLFKSSTDYRLTGSSPCINAGSNAVWSGTASVTDYAGRAITNAAGAIVAPGGVVDIGAYERKPSIHNAARFMLLFD